MPDFIHYSSTVQRTGRWYRYSVTQLRGAGYRLEATGTASAVSAQQWAQRRRLAESRVGVSASARSRPRYHRRCLWITVISISICVCRAAVVAASDAGRRSEP